MFHASGCKVCPSISERAQRELGNGRSVRFNFRVGLHSISSRVCRLLWGLAASLMGNRQEGTITAHGSGRRGGWEVAPVLFLEMIQRYRNELEKELASASHNKQCQPTTLISTNGCGEPLMNSGRTRG
jgi:hypothetical protein